MKWISVKERFPEPDTEVIVWIPCDICKNKSNHKHDNHNYYGCYSDTYESCPCKGSATSYIHESWDNIECRPWFSLGDVTYWMPLPEAPE